MLAACTPLAFSRRLLPLNAHEPTFWLRALESPVLFQKQVGGTNATGMLRLHLKHYLQAMVHGSTISQAPRDTKLAKPSGSQSTSSSSYYECPLEIIQCATSLQVVPRFCCCCMGIIRTVMIASFNFLLYSVQRKTCPRSPRG